jgi:hypothetical protein
MYGTPLPAVLAILAFTSSADAQVELRWKYPENSKTTTTVTSKTQQLLTINKQEIETKSEETVVVSTTSGKRDKDGKLRRTGKVESLKASLSLPGGVELNYESGKKTEPPGTAADFLLDVFAAIPKVVTTVVHGKDGRVVAVEVDTKPLKDLPDNAKEILKGRFDPDYLKTAGNKQLDRIPSKPLKKGDTWSLTQEARIGGGQTLTFKMTYKYEGTVEKGGVTLDRISFKATEVKYDQAKTDSPLKATDSKLKVESSNGTLLFDRKRGMITSETDKLHITGDMTFEADGKELPAKLDLTMEKSMTQK